MSVEDLCPQTSTASRFLTIFTEEEIEELKTLNIPKSTMEKEAWAMNLLRSWLKHRNSQGIVKGLHVFKTPEEMTKDELNLMLSYFILEVRTVNGGKYKSGTLKLLISMIQYYYNRVHAKGWSIYKDSEFQKTRNNLDLAMKVSRAEGIDRKTRRAASISEEMEDELWKQNLLGDDSPTKLVETLLFLNGKNFALRSRDEHRRMTISSIEKHFDREGQRYYLEYCEDISKTSKGGLHDRRAEPRESRAYDNMINRERCIVALYDKYMSHRPENVDAFYLTPIQEPKTKIWYKRSPMGVNSLSKVVKNLFDRAGIEGFFTNHSLKRTTRTVLCDEGFGQDVVTKKTGHLSKSELDYLDLNAKKQQKMSDAINFCQLSSASSTSQKICVTNEGVDATVKLANSTQSATAIGEKPTCIIQKNGATVSIFV